MYNAVITQLNLSQRGTTVTEDEFKALLLIEGKSMRIDPMPEIKQGDTTPYYIAVVTNKIDGSDVRYAVGRSYQQALKTMIKNYYADN